MIDLINEILQTLRNNKLRTSLTGFAVAWGIFMLIVLLGMSRGVFNSFNSHASEQGNNQITIWGGNTSKAFKGYKENRRIRLRENDMETLESEYPSRIATATSMVSIDTAEISTPRDYVTGGITGVYPMVARSRGIKIIYGRFINQRDLDERRKVLVISKDNAEVLFNDASKAVGSTVKCMNLAFSIAGVYDDGGRSESYAPFSTVENLAGNTGYVGNIRLEVQGLENIADGEALENEVRATLGRVHQFDPEDQSAVWIWNQFVQFLTMGGALNILNIAIWVIGLFTMLSGIIGVSNIMFVSVRERTHEIGIRRAIGAKPHNILIQIIFESVAITALFGYIGILLGIGATEIIDSMFGNSDFLKNPTVDIRLAIYVNIVLIIAGALAGLFPALRALKIKPVEALRDE